MKKRYGWLWAGIALLGLLGVLLTLLPEPRNTLIRWALPENYAVWYGIWEWSGLEAEQLHPVVLNLAASEEPRKLAFAAMLGIILEDKAIEKEVEQPIIDSALFSETPEDKSKGLENTAKSFDNYSKKYQAIAENRAKEGKQLIPQETLDNWRKMALEKAAPDDVLLFNMLATYGLAKSDSAKAIREEAILRWQQAEPNNLAPLLYQQAFSVQELLEQAKTRHHYQEYNYAILRWMYQTLLQQLPNKQKNIATELIGIDAAAAFPIIKPLIEFCKKNPPEQVSADWQLCHSMAQKLREQPVNTLMRIVGISILQTLLENDVEKNALDNERAHIDWLFEQSRKHMNGVRIFEHNLQRLQDENINSELQKVEDFLRKEGLLLKTTENNT